MRLYASVTTSSATKTVEVGQTPRVRSSSATNGLRTTSRRPSAACGQMRIAVARTSASTRALRRTDQIPAWQTSAMSSLRWTRRRRMSNGRSSRSRSFRYRSSSIPAARVCTDGCASMRRTKRNGTSVVMSSIAS